MFFRQPRAVSPGRAQIHVDVHHRVAGVTGEACTRRCADVRRVADLVLQTQPQWRQPACEGGEICGAQRTGAEPAVLLGRALPAVAEGVVSFVIDVMAGRVVVGTTVEGLIANKRCCADSA